MVCVVFIKPLEQHKPSIFSIVHFKRFGSRAFTIHLIKIYSSFQNSIHTAKHYAINTWDNLIRFLSGVFLIFFIGGYRFGLFEVSRK